MTTDNDIQQKITQNKTLKHFSNPAEKGERGRPSKGSMWIIPRNLKCSYSQISRRITTIDFSNLILAGVYLPYYDGSPENTIEFECEIEILKTLCLQAQAQAKPLIIMGDFNADPSRNNKNDQILNEFIKTMSLKLVQKQKNGHEKITTYSKNGNASDIDHLMIMGSIKHDEKCSVTEDINNYSDHKPINICIESNFYEINQNKNVVRQRKINWKDKQIRKKYKMKITSKLNSLNHLKDKVKSTNQNENELKDWLNKMINNLNEALLSCAEEAMNDQEIFNKAHHKRKKYWFTKDVHELHKQKGYLYQELKKTNDEAIKTRIKEINKSIRKKKRESDKEKVTLQTEKFNQLFKSDKVEFWKAIKKTDKQKSNVNIQMDRLTIEFKQLFNEKLISCEENEEKSKNSIEEYLQENINNQTQVKIEQEDLISILKSLNNGKSIGHANISNEHFKYGITNELIEWLTVIFESIINRNVIPDTFNIGIVKPIIKDEKKLSNDINNVRPITISDTITNIFEKLILKELDKTHKIHDKQFGFKSNNSCNHAFFTLKETLNINKTRRNKTYLCAIDASKAFDKVNRQILLDKIKTKMDLKIFRVLKSYYENSAIIIQNNDEQSELIRTTIGVKQGGPLSPRLFAMYTEDLIEEIENTNYGITIKDTKIDIIMYADDIILLSNKLEDLERMLSITEEYGKRQEIKFNPSKTVYMIFGSNKKELTIHPRFDGIEIKRVNQMRYLGFMLNDKLTNQDHLKTRRILSINANNRLNKYGYYNNNMDPMLKSSLYKCYSRSVLLYGIENINLRKTELKKLQTIEATLIKRSLGLSNRTRNTNLLYALNIEPMDLRVKLSKLKFILRLMQNEYTKTFIIDLFDYYYTIGKFNKDSILNHMLIESEVQTLEFDEDKLQNDITSKLNSIKLDIAENRNGEPVKQIRELLKPNFNKDLLINQIRAF